MVRREELEIKKEVRGGKGDVYFYYIMKEEEMMGHGPMFARVVLPPGSSIGYHQHVGNMEPYYILKGTGIFTDTDGTAVEVKAGDCCLIRCGESHGLANDSDEDLELMQMILNEA